MGLKVAGEYIFKKFRDFDIEHYRGKNHTPGEVPVFPAGLWMNKGFSMHGNEHLGPWEISLEGVTVEYEQQTSKDNGS